MFFLCFLVNINRRLLTTVKGEYIDLTIGAALGISTMAGKDDIITGLSKEVSLIVLNL